VKLYQFKEMLLETSQSRETPVMKREIIYPVKEPMEYPTRESLTEFSISKDQVRKNSIVMDLND
jgi:hypothetical protein